MPMFSGSSNPGSISTVASVVCRRKLKKLIGMRPTASASGISSRHSESGAVRDGAQSAVPSLIAVAVTSPIRREETKESVLMPNGLWWCRRPLGSRANNQNCAGTVPARSPSQIHCKRS